MMNGKHYHVSSLHQMMNGTPFLDYSIDDDDADNDEWYDEISDESTRQNDTLFDSTGEYKYRHIVHGIDIRNFDLEHGIISTNSIFYDGNEHESYSTNIIQ